MEPSTTHSIFRRWMMCCLTVICTTAVQATNTVEAPPPSDLHCVVMPSAVVDVASGVSGRVEAIHVERGDTVRAGQVVAALESRVEQANLALAKARAGLETDIHLREARLGFERRKLDRTGKLHSNRVVSVHEQDEAETEAKLAQWQLRQAIDEKYLAGLELVRASEVLKRRSVESPIDGVVVDRFKWPGEYVEEEPVLRVARLDPLWVEVVAPVSMHGDVRRNMLAEVMTETEGGEVHEARVLVIDPMGDAASGTFRVRLELPNPDHKVLGGTKCKARFPQPARFAPETPPAAPAAVEKAGVDEPAPRRKVPQVRGSATMETSPVVRPRQPLRTTSVSRNRPDQQVRQTDTGWIVLTPSLESNAERRRLEASLREAGISDFLVMGHGPYRGRIALGVYKPLRMAERRRSQLAVLGFDAEVVPRSDGRSSAVTDSPSADMSPQANSERPRQGAALTQKDAAHRDERG